MAGRNGIAKWAAVALAGMSLFGAAGWTITTYLSAISGQISRIETISTSNATQLKEMRKEHKDEHREMWRYLRNLGGYRGGR